MKVFLEHGLVHDAVAFIRVIWIQITPPLSGPRRMCGKRSGRTSFEAPRPAPQGASLFIFILMEVPDVIRESVMKGAGVKFRVFQQPARAFLGVWTIVQTDPVFRKKNAAKQESRAVCPLQFKFQDNRGPLRSSPRPKARQNRARIFSVSAFPWRARDGPSATRGGHKLDIFVRRVFERYRGDRFEGSGPEQASLRGGGKKPTHRRSYSV